MTLLERMREEEGDGAALAAQRLAPTLVGSRRQSYAVETTSTSEMER
jgi:hypothetical protein